MVFLGGSSVFRASSSTVKVPLPPRFRWVASQNLNRTPRRLTNHMRGFVLLYRLLHCIWRESRPDYLSVDAVRLEHRAIVIGHGADACVQRVMHEEQDAGVWP